MGFWLMARREFTATIAATLGLCKQRLEGRDRINLAEKLESNSSRHASSVVDANVETLPSPALFTRMSTAAVSPIRNSFRKSSHGVGITDIAGIRHHAIRLDGFGKDCRRFSVIDPDCAHRSRHSCTFSQQYARDGQADA